MPPWSLAALSFLAGAGTLIGVLLGVALLSTIDPALVFFKIEASWGKVFEGWGGDHFDCRGVRCVQFQAEENMASELSSPNNAVSEAAVGRRLLITHEIVLAVVLAVEVALFCAIGTNFMSWRNGFEITRLFVEVGLLAVAMTPVIISGGIDLSVGSLMGLSAVLFGMLWRDAHWPIALAVIGTLGVGALAGCLNGLFVTWLRLPPLIVTLGTFSLFRGLAEGCNAWRG